MDLNGLFNCLGYFNTAYIKQVVSNFSVQARSQPSLRGGSAEDV